MDTPPQAALLDTYIGAAVAASNDLVATLCGHMSEQGMDAAARRVLLLLWITDDIPEKALTDQLGAAGAESALTWLARHGFVARKKSSVRLTAEGRGLWSLCGAEEMGDRLEGLLLDLVALRDTLQRTVGLLAKNDSSSETVAVA